jgi:hypothetical protein
LISVLGSDVASEIELQVQREPTCEFPKRSDKSEETGHALSGANSKPEFMQEDIIQEGRMPTHVIYCLCSCDRWANSIFAEVGRSKRNVVRW